LDWLLAKAPEVEPDSMKAALRLFRKTVLVTRAAALLTADGLAGLKKVW
jgi:hypothetical protein